MKKATGWIADDRTFFNEEDKNECKLYEELVMPFLAFGTDGEICSPEDSSIIIALKDGVCNYGEAFDEIEEKGIYFYDNDRSLWARVSYFPLIGNTTFLKMVNKYFNADYKEEEEEEE